MRVFATRAFDRFASREQLCDQALCEAVDRLQKGLVDADLGGGVVKQRVARQGQGRSGGYRTILAFRKGVRIVFLHGFAKNDKANLTDIEVREFKKAATLFLKWSEIEIDLLLGSRKWREVHCDGPILH